MWCIRMRCGVRGSGSVHSHSHELLVHNPQAPNYLMTTNISQDYTYPLLVLFAGNARWFAGERLQFVSQPGMFGIEYVRSGDALIKIEDKEILVHRDRSSSQCWRIGSSLLGQSIQSPLPHIVEQALGYMQKNMRQQLSHWETFVNIWKFPRRVYDGSSAAICTPLQ